MNSWGNWVEKVSSEKRGMRFWNITAKVLFSLWVDRIRCTLNPWNTYNDWELSFIWTYLTMTYSGDFMSWRFVAFNFDDQLVTWKIKNHQIYTCSWGHNQIFVLESIWVNLLTLLMYERLQLDSSPMSLYILWRFPFLKVWFIKLC